jgi:deoxyribodipyrimidine photo-lyase
VASTIVWFRNDLRIADNPALDAAALRGGPVVFLFIWSPDEDSPWQLGIASRWWLKRSLSAFEEDLASRGAKLIVRTGKSLDVLKEVIHQTGADAVYFSRLYESHAIRRDEKVTLALRKDGITVETFNANLLIEPWKITNTSGKPYRVFTPYWNRCQKQLAIVEAIPIRARHTIAGSQTIHSTAIEKLAFDVDTARTKQLDSCWDPGAASAPQPATHCHPNVLFARSASTSVSQNQRAPSCHGCSKSLTRNEATIMRMRLLIQPVWLSWRIPASTMG